MKTVILAGGLGTRLAEETDQRPKPMVEIGGKPLLWHIMHIYASHGFDEFVIALGYKSEIIKRYFLDYAALNSDFSIDLATGVTTIDAKRSAIRAVHLIDTGLDTMTGGRIKRLKEVLGNERFMLTYGDGLSNVNIKELLKFHESSEKLATVTAVRPPSRFGVLMLDQADPQVRSFQEKPQSAEGWINGGFFVLEPEVLDLIDGDSTVWEQEPLGRLADKGELAAFKHDGYFQPIDTLRDKRLAESYWHSGNAPWKVWE